MRKIQFVLFGLIIISLGWMYYAFYMKTSNMAYINLEHVYEDFTLKNELEEKLKKVQLTRQTILDSLKIRIQLLSKQMEDGSNKQNTDVEEKLQFLREQYFSKERQFLEDNQAASQDYNKQILQQLNQYVQDYGKNHNYQFIFGANGEGSIMYAQDAVNITEEVKEFVNAKYGGKGK